MFRHRLSVLSSFLFLSAAVSLMIGCSTTGPERAARAGESMQTVRGGIEKISAQVDKTVAALTDLVNNPQADLRPQFDAYTKELDELDTQRTLLKQRADAMRARRDEYFRGWKADTDEITNPELKEHAEARRAQLEERFQNIATSMEKAKELSEPLLAALHDAKALLSLDLTPKGVASLSDPVEKVNSTAEDLKEEINKILEELDGVAELLPSTTSKAASEGATKT